MYHCLQSSTQRYYNVASVYQQQSLFDHDDNEPEEDEYLEDEEDEWEEMDDDEEEDEGYDFHFRM